jgi:hypothetical protein
MKRFRTQALLLHRDLSVSLLPESSNLLQQKWLKMRSIGLLQRFTLPLFSSNVCSTNRSSAEAGKRGHTLVLSSIIITQLVSNLNILTSNNSILINPPNVRVTTANRRLRNPTFEICQAYL